MSAMRRSSRLRSGASRWELYRVGENSLRYVEQFEVPSWEQHEGRLTADDMAIEDAASTVDGLNPKGAGRSVQTAACLLDGSPAAGNRN